jgi:hypothetical protein
MFIDINYLGLTLKFNNWVITLIKKLFSFFITGTNLGGLTPPW